MPVISLSIKVNYTAGDHVEILRECRNPYWQKAVVVGVNIEVTDRLGGFSIIYVCESELDLQKLNGSTKPGIAQYHVKPKNIRPYYEPEQEPQPIHTSSQIEPAQKKQLIWR